MTIVLKRVRVLGAVAAASLAVASLGACGTSSSGGGDEATPQLTSAQLDAVSALVADAEGLATWQGPDAKIDIGSLKGKTVYALALDLGIPHINTIASVMKEVGDESGVNVVVVDGKSQVSNWSRGIQSAISAKAAAIVAIAVDLDAVKSQLQQARKSGVAVVTGLSTDAGSPIPAEFKDFIQGAVAEQYKRAGQVEAAWVIRESKGKANVLAIDAPGLAVSIPVKEGIQEVFDKHCPACKVTWIHSPTASWGSQLLNNVQTSLRADPKINYVIPEFDGMATSVVAAVHQAGAQDRVKVSTYNATGSILALLKSGDVVGADSGTQGPWEAWALMDAAFRAILGEAAVPDYHIPVRLFTSSNIDSIDLDKGEGAWYGPLDYAAKFRALWGLSGGK
jgi:ribose transport system substrate-binding protein